jgi:hypothetical protein
MKETHTTLGIVVFIIAAAAMLYFYGPSSLRGYVTGMLLGNVHYTVISQGNNALSVTERVNYRIQNTADFAQLWTMVVPDQEAPPEVDFSKNEVLAVFDGTHPSGGYSVAVTSVTDSNGTRTVHVQRTTPGSTCAVTEAITSPYQILVVPKTTLALAHDDVAVTKECP